MKEKRCYQNGHTIYRNDPADTGTQGQKDEKQTIRIKDIPGHPEDVPDDSCSETENHVTIENSDSELSRGKVLYIE